VGFDLVAEDEVGAGIAALGLVELVAEGGQGLGAPGRGERVEPDEQFAGAGPDVAGGGEGFADEGVCLVAGAGVVAVQGAGQGGFGVVGGHPDGVGDLLGLGVQAHRPAPDGGGPDGGAPGGGGGTDGGIGLVLSDAGYCSEANLTCPGPDRLIAVGKRRDLEKAARGQDTAPDWGGPAGQAMRDRLKTGDGIAAYRQRGHIAETPHGHIKHNIGIRQLSMRGKPKASAEWEFICAVHNLFKALTAGRLTARALAALAS
jgi:DDE family transposase